MVAYYQRSISAWMDGTESLDDGEYRVYDVICNLIYLNNGPIVIHETGISGRCNQHPLKFRRNLQKLIERKKLLLDPAGKVTNARVEHELSKISRGGRPKGETAGRPPADPPRVERGSPGGEASKPLKNKKQGEGGIPLDKKDTKLPDGSLGGEPPPPAYADERHELWGEGVPVLVSFGIVERTARGMIGRWLKLCGDDAARLLGVIRRAQELRVVDPVPWVTMAIKNGGGTNGKATNSLGGYSGVAARLRQRAASELDLGEPPAGGEQLHGR